MMPYCRTCETFAIDLEKHVCPLLWECRDEQTGDEWIDIYARDPDTAATKYGERCDLEGDYTIIKGEPMEVEVRRKGTETSEWFRVTGETVSQYSSDPIPPPEAK